MSKPAMLPLEPLAAIAAAQHGGPVFTNIDLAKAIGMTDRAINRWKVAGGIPWTSADEAAINLGLHPILVWGDDWLNVKGDYAKLAAEAERELEAGLINQISDEALAY